MSALSRAIVATSLAWAGGAAAQNMDAAPSMQSAIIASTTNANIIRGMYDGGRHVGTSGIYVGRPGSADVRDRGATRPGPRPPLARPATLAYQSTPALRRATVEGLVRRAARTNPEAARAMAVQFTQHDYATIYQNLTASAGLRENDAADATAAYTLLGWQIANRDAKQIGNAAAAAVRNQIAARLAADPRLSQPATRAALGEELKLFFVTVHAGWQSATREGTTRAYSDGIAAMFRAQSGMDLRALRLTNQGFASK